jgi:iron complex transport system ATP-binding protein
MSEGLIINGLRVAYGRRTVIENLWTPALLPGTVTAVLGPNGSGKSTLLRALAGLTPSTGAVSLDGRTLSHAGLAERARRLVYLPQSLPAAVHLRVIESLLAARHASPHRAAGEGASASVALDERDVREDRDPLAACEALLDRLGIGALAMRHLDELSGGQAQLAGLAQALIRRPRVLLLDEPLSALDLNHQFHVMSLIAEETRRRGIVTLVVLHDLSIAMRHADRVLVMQQGNVRADGAPEEALSASLLAAVYGVQARVERCSRGLPVVIVDGLTTDASRVGPEEVTC